MHPIQQTETTSENALILHSFLSEYNNFNKLCYKLHNNDYEVALKHLITAPVELT